MTALACSPDGRRMLATGPDGGLNIWTIKGHGTAQQVSTLPGHVRSVAFGPTGPLTAVATGSTVNLCETGATHALLPTGFRSDVVGLALSVDGRVLAAGAADGSLRCWLIPGGGLLAASRQQGAVTAMALAGDGGVLASADTFGTVRIWAVPGGRLMVELQLPVPETVVRLAFSPDCVHIAAAGASGRLVVWDLASGAVQHTLASPTGVASGLAFSPDGRYLAVTAVGGGVSVRSLSAAPKPSRAGTRLRIRKPIPRSTHVTGGWFMDVLRKFGAAAWAP
jgi:WD40 repeat protein